MVFSACKSCIVTGSETEDIVSACFQAKTAGLTPPVPSPGGIKDDVWTSGIGPSGYYPGDTGTYPDGGTGLKTAMMCSHPDNTAKQKQMCLECVKIADGATYYDRVAQIEACIAKKRKVVPPVTGDICDNPDLTDEIRMFCKACQPLVANPQDEPQLAACVAEKRATPLPPGPLPVYQDTNDPCDTNSRAFNVTVCSSGGGTVYAGTPVSQDTNDPCDTNSQMFDAAACTSGGGETYTSIQEEISPVVPLVILGGAAALIFVGMRKS